MDAWVGRLVAGRYRIKRLLGSGGMGDVYLAVQEALDREVALKVIRSDQTSSPSAVARFEREARAIARLNHPHIVTIHDFGTLPPGASGGGPGDVGGLFIVMEVLRGRSLTEVLRERISIDWPRTLSVVRDVASALAAAHAADIVHRDLKPDNIMLVHQPGDADGGDPMAKVLDFGVVKLRDRDVDGGARSGTLTEAGTLVGTPNYMAPEAILGTAGVEGGNEGGADHRADLYALGLVWMEMLTGKRVFDARNPAAAIVQAATQPIPTLRDVDATLNVPASVDAVLRQLLERDVAARTASAAALVEALDRCIVEAASSAQTGPRASAAKAAKALRRTLGDDEGRDPEGRDPEVRHPEGRDPEGRVPTTAWRPATTPLTSPALAARFPAYDVATAPDDDVTEASPPDASDASAFTGTHRQTPARALDEAVLPTQMLPRTSPSKRPLLVGLATALGVVLGAGVLIAGAVVATSTAATTTPATTVTTATTAPVVPPAPAAELAEPATTTAPAATTTSTALSTPTAATTTAKKKARATPVLAVPEPPKSRELTSDDVEDAIGRNLGSASRCRNSNITTPRSGPGLLVDHCPSYRTVDVAQQLVLTVASTGKVIGARFANAAINADPLAACVLESVRLWSFPAFDGPPVEIAQRVTFKPCVPINYKCVFSRGH